MLGLQLCFVSSLWIYAFGNQYNQEGKLIAVSAEMEDLDIDEIYIGQCVDLHVNIHEICQMQIETRSVVSVKYNDRKNCHK